MGRVGACDLVPLKFLGISLGMTTISYSPVGSDEMPMERRSNHQLGSGHCLASALHRPFTDQNWRFAALSPVELFSTLFTASLRRARGGLRISSDGSPVLPVL
ncbi:hypothetical protein HAX54_034496 [Datura stramonium]|uniref:Uncharacterized protein n=1 Tax=Datura stramonium TaxID=4076 RepID=A0ABS8VHK8_DATST|nr:hypothetical protein [Datura stramonium]